MVTNPRPDVAVVRPTCVAIPIADLALSPRRSGIRLPSGVGAGAAPAGVGTRMETGRTRGPDPSSEAIMTGMEPGAVLAHTHPFDRLAFALPWSCLMRQK